MCYPRVGSRGSGEATTVEGDPRSTAPKPLIFAVFPRADASVATVHVQLARLLQVMSRADTGNAVSSADGSILERGEESSRGKKTPWHGRSTCRLAPPSARSIARSPFAQEVGLDPRFRSPEGLQGSYPVLPLSRLARERGERNSSQPISSSGECGSQFVTKNQIRPVNEAGRAVGFIPVTPCSLGKRQPEGREHPSFLGCLFDCGRRWAGAAPPPRLERASSPASA